MDCVGAIAEWIRRFTPGLSDTFRHKLLYYAHKSLIPLGIGLFLWVPILRWVLIGLFGLAIVSELYFKDCYFYFIEQEFCKLYIPDLSEHVFNMFGWNISGREKMAFTIGVNVVLFGGMIWWMIQTQPTSVTTPDPIPSTSSSHTKSESPQKSSSQSEPQSDQTRQGKPSRRKRYSPPQVKDSSSDRKGE